MLRWLPVLMDRLSRGVPLIASELPWLRSSGSVGGIKCEFLRVRGDDPDFPLWILRDVLVLPLLADVSVSSNRHIAVVLVWDPSCCRCLSAAQHMLEGLPFHSIAKKELEIGVLLAAIMSHW